MYRNDHNPPHFHARYAEDEIVVDIQTLKVLEGEVPARVFGMILEWAMLHEQELLANWDSIRTSGDVKKIMPLE